MTREEEYTQAASDYILSPVVPVCSEKLAYGDFINGVKWADQNPRKGLWDAQKVIKYINEVLPNYVELNYVFDEIQVNYNKFKNNFIHDLKKAMED